MDCRSVDSLIQAAQAGTRHIQLWEPSEVSDHDVMRIAKATHDYSTFTHLGFFRCNLTMRQIEILCKGLSSSVRHLLLQYSHVTDMGMYFIAELLDRSDSCLERLFVCDDVIGDKGIRMLCNVLENNNMLKLLCVTDNMFTNEGLDFLKRMLRRNTTLKTMHFSGHAQVILDRSLVNQVSTMCKYPHVRADWQRILAFCNLKVNRLARNSALKGFPSDLMRSLHEMLCERIVAEETRRE
jgi:hypothetical protein